MRSKRAVAGIGIFGVTGGFIIVIEYIVVMDKQPMYHSLTGHVRCSFDSCILGEDIFGPEELTDVSVISAYM